MMTRCKQPLLAWVLHSLRGRLMLLMLLAALPSLAIQLYGTYRAREQALAHTQAHLLNQARVLAVQYEEHVAVARRQLLALAELPALDTARGCAALAAAHRSAPAYIANLVAIDPDGRMRCAARGGSAINVADRPYFQRALGAAGFLGGDYIVGRLTGEPVVIFTYTVHREGRPEMVLGAALDLTWLRHHPQFSELPTGAAYALYDHDGTRVLRHPQREQESIAPESPAPPFWKTLLALRGPGIFRAQEGDGIERIFGSSVLGAEAVAYGYLVVSLPVSAAYAEADQALQIGLFGLVTACILGLLIGVVGGGALVLRPLRPIFDTVRRVAGGDLEARTGVHANRSNEIEHLANEVDHMAAVLATKSREHQQSEQAVREGLARAQAYLDIVGVMVVALDTQGNITLANHKTCEILGCAAEGCCVAGNWFDHFIPPEIRDELKRVFHRVMAGDGESVDYFENEVLTATGERRLVAWRNTLLRDACGHITGTLSAGEDITERKRAEAHLQATRQMLQLVTDTIPYHVFWKDRHSRYLGCNIVFARSAGLGDNGEIVGKADTDLTWREQAELYQRDDAEVMSTGVAKLNYVEPQSLADGSCLWLETSKVPLRDATGEVIGVLGLYQDISRRKELEAERERLHAVLQQAQKMEALGQLTGGIAHDFNNILTSMLGFSGLALRRHVPDPHSPLADYLREVISAGERARDLVAKMLTFSRAQPAGVAQPLALAPVVVETLRMLASMIPASIQMERNIEDNLPEVVIASIDFQQILINLVINARDALPGKGKITIGLARAHIDNQVCAACRHEIRGDYIALSVADNGQGIPPEVLPRIFDPFFTTKEVGKGTGMGLAVVHGLVFRSGRHILVDSRPGAGSVFQVLFPGASNAAAVALPAIPAAKAALPLRPAGLMRVMVIDDQEAIRYFLKEIVEAAGCAVTVFGDPLQALAAFRQAPELWHAVITDQTMPDMSGVEVMLAMHQLRPTLPVILCTGYSDELDAAKALQMGARAFFNKPMPPDAVIAVLNELLAAPAPGAANAQKA